MTCFQRIGIAALAAALPGLAEEGDPTTVRRALHACREVATYDSASRLLEFALDEDADRALRAEALQVLASWSRPLTRDGVEAARHSVDEHEEVEAAGVEAERLVLS